MELADSYYLASVDTQRVVRASPLSGALMPSTVTITLLAPPFFPTILHRCAVTALTASIAAATAREVSATGIDWVFAPTLAVA